MRTPTHWQPVVVLGLGVALTVVSGGGSAGDAAMTAIAAMAGYRLFAGPRPQHRRPWRRNARDQRRLAA